MLEYKNYEYLRPCMHLCFQLTMNIILQKLEPLSDAPKFTAEQLEEKIRQAEENRQRVICFILTCKVVTDYIYDYFVAHVIVCMKHGVCVWASAGGVGGRKS